MNRVARTVLILSMLCAPGLARAQSPGQGGFLMPLIKSGEAKCSLVNGQVNTIHVEVTVDYSRLGSYAFVFTDRASGQTYPFPGRAAVIASWDFPLPAGRAYDMKVVYAMGPTSIVSQPGWLPSKVPNIIVPPVQVIGQKCSFSTPLRVRETEAPGRR